ncbi:AHH domain-containing protein [Lampropedia aestuarii]|uniref:AHH domain-containing protein n=1 Tax=Lampropedia aestuarii TaxID=2562762 RepID=UPI001455EC42|nr:AHH domain-containing protein [Lampropedia aestuarii]
MTKCGEGRPSDRHRAHHIVMSNSKDPKMVALRDKMNILGLDINDASNGVWLPEIGADRLPAEISTAHKGEGVHGIDYKTKVYDKLINSKNQEEFLEGLEDLKGQMKNGVTFFAAEKRNERK